MKPYAGREVVYVDGQNEGKLVVLDAGFTRLVGKINLDPTGTRAMNGQKHPITDVGIRNLTAKLIKMWEAEMQFAECEVTTKPARKSKAGRRRWFKSFTLSRGKTSSSTPPGSSSTTS